MARMRTDVNTHRCQSGSMVRVTRRKPRTTPFARALRGLMDREGWSNREAADAIGVSHTQVGRYLAGAEPSISRASMVAEMLGVTLDALAATGPPPDRSLELTELARQIQDAADGQERIAHVLQELSQRVARLGAQAPDDSEMG